jgi:Pentapeptide repeats (8 copies)
MPEPIVAYWKARLADWEAIPNDVRITIGLAVLAALLLALTIWWLWWRLPKRMAARLALDDPKDRADVEDNFRKTVGQALGGIVVLLGAGVAYLQFSQQQRAAHDLLISNQVAKGFELLGNKDKDAVVLRLGGIYALEGVMNNSAQYHQAVLEALSAFVREGAKQPTTPPTLPPTTPGPPPQGLPTDIQAALTVIGRRSDGPGIVDLTKANIARADLGGADLIGANLGYAILTFANLAGAKLIGANLTDANLGGVILGGANLTGVTLRGVNLRGAILSQANLTRADLTNANLTYAGLTGADLTNANLTRADLTNANLGGQQPSIGGQQQLDAACGSDAKLPPGLTLKPCPPKSSP